jgi:SAM-dependent methyltransferase
MRMRSGQPATSTAKAAGLWLAALIVLHAAAAGAQQPAPAQPTDEFAKQERIYRSQGADIPSGYVTGRVLSDYADALPKGFCGALSRLRSTDRWLDIGAGSGGAILDYTSPDGQSAASAKCAGGGSRANAVAVSIEDRRTDAWTQQAAKLGGERIRYFFGRRFRDYPAAQLGKFQLITDVYGAFSYTDDLSAFMERVLSLLEVDGAFYSLVQSVHLENGQDDPKTYYLTELQDADGRDVKVCSWLKQISCVNVTCESHTDWHTPTELIDIRKVCNDVSVTPAKLLKYEAGNPPGRKFVLAPRVSTAGASAPARPQ